MRRLLAFSVITIFIFTSINSFSQNNTPSANEVADSVQSLRNQARRLWINPKATKEQLQESTRILKAAFVYLEKPMFKDLAQGNFYLKFRTGDVAFDLLNAYVRNKQYAEASTIFEKMYDLNSSWYALVAKDSVYAELRKLPRMNELINQFKLRNSIWQGKTLATTYQPNLSEDEKIAGLSQLWMQAKYNFVYFNKLSYDWNQTYLEFLPQVRATKSTSDYYRVLQRFYATLGDGHTNVFLPAEIRNDFGSRPPIRTDLIEGRVLITAVESDSLRKAGIIPGLEILKIDDQDVHDYVKNKVKPYLSSSTAQDLEIRAYSYNLLSGSAQQPVKLELKNSATKQWSQVVNRTGYKDVRSKDAINFKVINGFGYLQINNFEDPTIIRKFDSLYTEIAKTKGLIIDVRNNGGGDSWIGYHILSTLTDRETATSSSRILTYNPRTAKTEWFDDGAGTIRPDKKRLYTMPVMMLISARTFSAAEDFTVAFDCMKRGKLIGQATGGSTGQPFSFNLPGGGWARVCSKEDTYPDGKKFVGVGIQPDVAVDVKVNDILKGRDVVLENALALLQAN